MLIAQLSDLHIDHQRPEKAQAAAAAVSHLLELPVRPDAVIVSGDCADHGLPEEYRTVQSLLGRLPMPVYVVPGNHDDRAVMQRVIGTQGTQGLDGFIQYVVDCGPLRLIALDTQVPGQGGGLLDTSRLEWLAGRLDEAPKQPTVIFMHHPPLVAGLQVMDSIGLAGTDRLRALVARHPQVERLLAGHTHMAQTLRFAGTLLMVCPGTDHSLLPDLSQPQKLVVQMQAPLCLLHAWSEHSGLITYSSVIGQVPVITLHDGQAWL